MKNVEASIVINLPAHDVLNAFIEQQHLHSWWGVSRSLIELRKGGLYSLVWQQNEQCLDYLSTGVIAEYLPACQLRIEKFLYVNPQRQLMGPMELLILTTPEDNNSTELTVVQSGYQSGGDWDWLYDAVKKAWPEVLVNIKSYLEGLYILK